MRGAARKGGPYREGASAIKCCYAAAGSGTGSEETGLQRPTEQENLDPQPQRNRRRQEDVSKGEPSRRQTSLHSRSSDLTSELQSSVRSDEVVIATEQLQMLIEPLRRASVGKRSSRKVCRALPDGQIQPLDERRVQCRRVLGVVERVFESPRGSVQRSPFDLDDAIVPARF